MAVGHVNYNHSTVYGALLKNPMTRLEDAFQDLNEILLTMQQMIDGNGSDDAHYAYMTEMFGFVDSAGDPSHAVAHSAYNELGSLLAKLNTDGSVTSVNAALKQAFSKFR